MRSPSQILNGDRGDITSEEWKFIKKYIDEELRYQLDSYDFNCIMGWWALGDDSIPLSPKEAGFE